METHSSILARRIPVDGGAWWATVDGVARSWTWLSTHTHMWFAFCVCRVSFLNLSRWGAPFFLPGGLGWPVHTPISFFDSPGSQLLKQLDYFLNNVPLPMCKFNVCDLKECQNRRTSWPLTLIKGWLRCRLIDSYPHTWTEQAAGFGEVISGSLRTRLWASGDILCAQVFHLHNLGVGGLELLSAGTVTDTRWGSQAAGGIQAPRPLHRNTSPPLTGKLGFQSTDVTSSIAHCLNISHGMDRMWTHRG